mmetsp:Transcript_70792/g.163665  ORF Transcript_70792/g.163665 Transcript_70792/m.163665 type:complete len:220 (+) Transcript_70792:2018-2677(+)
MPPRYSKNCSTCGRLTWPQSVRYLSNDGRISWYKDSIWSMLPSLMDREGKCGRKSLPTKKHMKTKSSIARSKSYGLSSGMRSLRSSNWRARYWRKMGMARIWKGFWMPMSSASSFSPVHSEATCPVPPQRVHFFSDLGITTSRMMEKWASCVASPSMIKSASAPYRRCLMFGSYSGCARCNRMNCMILCSPSLGTFASERMTRGLSFCHSGSLVVRSWM